MDRFIAMLWDDRIASRSSRVAFWRQHLARMGQGWTAVIDHPGFCVVCLASHKRAPIAAFDDGAGVVIGDLFAKGRECEGRASRIDQSLCGAIRATKGAHLISHFWGRYVALWYDQTRKVCSILRDPCGALPCFLSEFGGVQLACSYIADLIPLAGFRASTDWDHIRGFLIDNHFINRTTGLREVTELLPGEQLIRHLNGELQRQWAWNGAALAAHPKQQSFDDACREVRETTAACFTAWAKTTDHILVRLSGGLDSTIAASLLSRAAGATITGFHFTATGYEGYEDRLARLAADRLGITLVEREAPPNALDFRSILDTPPLARPTRHVLAHAADQVVRHVCEESAIDTIMTGHGGDALFLQRSLAVHSLSDDLVLRGLTRHTWRRAYETSMLLEWPFWEVIRGALRDTYLHWRQGVPWAKLQSSQSTAPLIRRGADPSADADEHLHPWLARGAHLPRSKWLQLDSILALRNYQPVVGSALTRAAINPLICQPIIEFALRTPTSLFVEGGRDRSLERHAFADVIPVEIARRTSKGFIAHSLLETFHHNLPFLREFVLDGELAAQPWFNRESAEAILTLEGLSRGDALGATISMVVAEGWLHSWRGQGLPTVHAAYDR